VKIKNRTNGHNCYGRITMRRRGGGHKRFLRSVDFRHGKKEVQAVVERIEYDPNRSANIALVKYFDGEKRYILATEKMSEGSKIFSSKNAQAEYHDGMSLPLSLIPQGLFVNCVEFEPDGGGRFARSAGAAKSESMLKSNAVAFNKRKLIGLSKIHLWVRSRWRIPSNHSDS
jgi:large subunit ribosomal protein L2